MFINKNLEGTCKHHQLADFTLDTMTILAMGFLIRVTVPGMESPSVEWCPLLSERD